MSRTQKFPSLTRMAIYGAVLLSFVFTLSSFLPNNWITLFYPGPVYPAPKSLSIYDLSKEQAFRATVKSKGTRDGSTRDMHFPNRSSIELERKLPGGTALPHWLQLHSNIPLEKEFFDFLQEGETYDFPKIWFRFLKSKNFSALPKETLIKNDAAGAVRLPDPIPSTNVYPTTNQPTTAGGPAQAVKQLATAHIHWAFKDDWPGSGPTMRAGTAFFLETYPDGRYVFRPTIHALPATKEEGRWTLTNNILDLNPLGPKTRFSDTYRSLRLFCGRFFDAPHSEEGIYLFPSLITNFPPFSPQTAPFHFAMLDNSRFLHVPKTVVIEPGSGQPDTNSPVPNLWRLHTKSDHEAVRLRLQVNQLYIISFETHPAEREIGNWTRTNALIYLHPKTSEKIPIDDMLRTLRFFSKQPMPGSHRSMDYLVPSVSTNYPPYWSGLEPELYWKSNF